MNGVGRDIGLTFKGSASKSVEFLDTITTLNGTKIETDLFIKPTDAQQFLNRRSDHPPHMFKAIPYSQMRRTVVICSNPDKRNSAIEHMSQKFLNSGYNEKEIAQAKERIMKLERKDVLKRKSSQVEGVGNGQLLTFVINHNTYVKEHLNDFIKENNDDLQKLVGEDMKIMVAERRNMNTGSLLFKKSRFSKVEREEKCDQKCERSVCGLRSIITLDKNLVINNQKITLDFRLNCCDDYLIYVTETCNCKHLCF